MAFAISNWIMSMVGFVHFDVSWFLTVIIVTIGWLLTNLSICGLGIFRIIFDELSEGKSNV